MVVYTVVNESLIVDLKESKEMITADLYLLVAETRCAHGRLLLDDAARRHGRRLNRLPPRRRAALYLPGP